MRQLLSIVAARCIKAKHPQLSGIERPGLVKEFYPLGFVLQLHNPPMIRLTAMIASVLWLMCPCAMAEEKYPTDPAKWEVVKLPDKGDWDARYQFFQRANGSNHEWEVASIEGKVSARLYGDAPPDKSPAPDFDTTLKLQDVESTAFKTLKVSDGWIAAYNRGEFGAAVYWFSHDGKNKIRISNHQINQFILEGDRIFAVEGLAHLSLSRGSMIEIAKLDEKWSAIELFPLPGAGQAIARVGNGDYVIVTSGALLRVNLDKEMLMLVPYGDWEGFYPNSVAVDGEFIYIGMRQFVARCKLGKSVQSFDLLVLNAQWLNTEVIEPFKESLLLKE